MKYIVYAGVRSAVGEHTRRTPPMLPPSKNNTTKTQRIQASVGAMRKQILILLIIMVMATPALAATPPIYVADFENIDTTRLVVDTGNSYLQVAGVNGSAIRFEDLTAGNAYYIVLNATELKNLNVFGQEVYIGGYYKIESVGSSGAGLLAYGIYGYDSSNGYYHGFIVVAYYNGTHIIIDTWGASGSQLNTASYTIPVTLDSGWHKIFIDTIIYNSYSTNLKYYATINNVIVDNTTYTVNKTISVTSVNYDVNEGGVLAGATDTLSDSTGNTWVSLNLAGNVTIDSFGVYASLTDLPPAPTETITYTTTITTVSNTTITKTVTSPNTVVKTITIGNSSSNINWRLLGLGAVALLLLILAALKR